jgi:glutathione S-transferase
MQTYTNADSSTYPLLYTFRRCPYAIRARMALAYAQISVQHYEVDLKNKPQAMIIASPKATVPVLIVNEGWVIDESIDIILWALTQSDPEGWLIPDLKTACDDLIHANDFIFKPILDNYKYPQKSSKKDPIYYRDHATEYLNQLNSLLMKNRYLLGNQISIADVALFPFIRQFYMVDPPWFEQSEFKLLLVWLHSFLNSDLFLRVMKKI